MLSQNTSVMNKQGIWLSLLLSFMLLSLSAQNKVNLRAKWFVDSRFGMFIHWGLYSGAEGIWKGERLRYDNHYAEWIYYRNSIEKQEYVELLNYFDWDNIDAESWVLAAKKAGMKYIIFTAKHHDGFALWHSKVSDYNVGHYTKGKRDIVKELAEACKKHNIRLGLYYSHWIDWEHPYGWSHDKELYPISKQQYDMYWQQKVIPQIQELLTNYGDIAMLWFDMWIHHSQSIITKQQLEQLKATIRALQPDCLINSRLGLSLQEEPDIDFKTLNDNELGNRKQDFPWQSPATIAHSWGYCAYEEQWKSTTTLLHNLINNVSLNGNMVLNIGPRANGDLPFEIEDRLQAIGTWLKQNGESIYGAQAYDLPKQFNDWGRISCKILPNGKTRLYLHVYNWSLNPQLLLSGVKVAPQRAYLLQDSTQKIAFSFQEVLTKLQLPKQQPNPYVSVIVLEYNTYPPCQSQFVAQDSKGGFALNFENAKFVSVPVKFQSVKRYGSIPEHISVDTTIRLKWDIFVDSTCQLKADISYHADKIEKGSILSLYTNGQELNQKVQVTSQTVGEPNAKWHIKAFKSHTMGTLKFAKAGFYTVELELMGKKLNPIDFQWIYIR